MCENSVHRTLLGSALRWNRSRRIPTRTDIVKCHLWQARTFANMSRELANYLYGQWSAQTGARLLRTHSKCATYKKLWKRTFLIQKSPTTNLYYGLRGPMSGASSRNTAVWSTWHLHTFRYSFAIPCQVRTWPTACATVVMAQQPQRDSEHLQFNDQDLREGITR
jgi:hypothetical protein